MKGKKQFVALLLVAVLVFGGVFPAFHPMSNVYAEETQTEQQVETQAPTDDEEPTEAPTEQPTETQAPTGDEEPTEAPTEQPTETQAPTDNVEPTEAPTEQPLSVTDGAETFTLPEKGADNVPIESGAVDYFDNQEVYAKVKADQAISIEGLKKDTNYGNDAIEIYFTDDMNAYTDKGKDRVIDGDTYNYGVQMKGNGAFTYADGTVTATNAVKIVANKTGTVYFALSKTGDTKPVNFNWIEDGEIKLDPASGVGLTDHGSFTFNVVEGKAYYL